MKLFTDEPHVHHNAPIYSIRNRRLGMRWKILHQFEERKGVLLARSVPETGFGWEKSQHENFPEMDRVQKLAAIVIIWT